MEQEKRYKKGYFIETALAIGIPAGIPVGLVLGNIAFGPLIGVIIGLTTGFILEKTKNKNPLEITEAERIKKNKFYRISLTFGVIILIGFIILLLINRGG